MTLVKYVLVLIRKLSTLEYLIGFVTIELPATYLSLAA